MFQLIIVVFVLFLFAMSLTLISRSAEQRARSRTELFYAKQIREETDAIRLQNEKTKMEIMNMNSMEVAAREDVCSEVVIEDVERTQNFVQQPLQKPKLKELELDERALEFVSRFQPKHEEIEINLQEVTVYEEPNSWFSFPEVDLFMSDRPQKGLYYVSGKVMEVLDDMSAIISDGTGERMLYHHKVQQLTVGDIIISQVEIDKGIWHFITVWEINKSDQHNVKQAM